LMLKTTISKSALAVFVAWAALVVGPSLAAKECMTAAQCRGPTPKICMRCSNGTSACAHWACVHHTCEIQTCAGKMTRY
jgi:hypothetical protein